MRSASSGADEVVEVLADLVNGRSLALGAECRFLVELRHGSPPLLSQDAAMKPPPSTRARGSTNS